MSDRVGTTYFKEVNMSSKPLKIVSATGRARSQHPIVARLRPIRNERDYKRARKLVSALMDARPRTAEGNALEILATLVESYERKAFPLRETTPLEAVQFHMEQNDLPQAALARLIGANRASEFLSGRKPALSLGEVRKIRAAWNIPADFLIARL